jgi:GTP cyclohydrolase I
LNDDARLKLAETLEAAGWSSARDPELNRTPERFFELLQSFADYGNPEPLSTFPAESKELVAATGLAFRSLCVHHIMPFFGYIDVVYAPGTQACGFGGILRAVQHFSRRPQVQERLVIDIANFLHNDLNADGVLVRCRARQMCVEIRRTDASPVFVSQHATGILNAGPRRDEALALLTRHEPAP